MNLFSGIWFGSSFYYPMNYCGFGYNPRSDSIEDRTRQFSILAVRVILIHSTTDYSKVTAQYQQANEYWINNHHGTHLLFHTEHMLPMYRIDFK
jgi:hypothetical protein